MTATFIKNLDGERQRLYRCDPPLAGQNLDDETPAPTHEYVMSSRALYAYEVYLFAADADGEVTNWVELPGSLKSVNDVEEPLRELGYTIVVPETAGVA